ncbi:hypothetical protein IX39_20365 [Chryseobacterium formosense]|uniref:TIR domain-containing protein n=1 Tax=Chryseobacterium formosense TaxID=236814 RepID=A0A085YYT8_9FLAO|nr:toll/interleukin-1 receptor domain-containing protein [Chryseobacterium formosense]KFE97351.1 hypothetical protein IX39_20365 [Chryseobacterium formosense]SFT91354.1 MTH538 TIR-like domain [Chryseobacterium formosense]
MKYDAFISYSHSDCGTIAPAIQKAIENIGKPWYKLSRNLNVFRDETNLGANPHLWENIEKALENSENFILLASPKASESKWIIDEIEKWAEKDSQFHKFNIVITSGEIHWNNIKNDFDWEKTNCLPKSLKGKFSSEPLYIDLTDYVNKKNRPIDNKSSGFTYKIVKIISAITGIEPREIESDEKKRKTTTIFALTLGIISLVSISLLGYMFYRQKETNEQNAIANNLIAEGNKHRESDINKTLLFYAKAYETNKDSATFSLLNDFYKKTVVHDLCTVDSIGRSLFFSKISLKQKLRFSIVEDQIDFGKILVDEGLLLENKENIYKYSKYQYSADSLSQINFTNECSNYPISFFTTSSMFNFVTTDNKLLIFANCYDGDSAGEHTDAFERHPLEEVTLFYETDTSVKDFYSIMYGDNYIQMVKGLFWSEPTNQLFVLVCGKNEEGCFIQKFDFKPPKLLDEDPNSIVKNILNLGINDFSKAEKDSLKITKKDNPFFNKIQKLLTKKTNHHATLLRHHGLR